MAEKYWSGVKGLALNLYASGNSSLCLGTTDHHDTHATLLRLRRCSSGTRLARRNDEATVVISRQCKGVRRSVILGTNSAALVSVVLSARQLLPLLPEEPTFGCSTISVAKGQNRPPALRKNSQPRGTIPRNGGSAPASAPARVLDYILVSLFYRLEPLYPSAPVSAT
jgi:hypothetical protein